MRLLVEDFGDGAELFLACRVPDLQLEVALLDFEEAGPEIDPHRNIMLGIKLVLRQAGQDARLPDTRVAENDELEELIV